jgi:hypothetical protein
MEISMPNTPVRTIDPIFNAKDKVVLRFNKHDAQIARNWQDAAKPEHPFDASSMVRV